MQWQLRERGDVGDPRQVERTEPGQLRQHGGATCRRATAARWLSASSSSPHGNASACRRGTIRATSAAGVAHGPDHREPADGPGRRRVQRGREPRRRRVELVAARMEAGERHRRQQRRELRGMRGLRSIHTRASTSIRPTKPGRRNSRRARELREPRPRHRVACEQLALAGCAPPARPSAARAPQHDELAALVADRVRPHQPVRVVVGVRHSRRECARHQNDRTSRAACMLVVAGCASPRPPGSCTRPRPAAATWRSPILRASTGARPELQCTSTILERARRRVQVQRQPPGPQRLRRPVTRCSTATCATRRRAPRRTATAHAGDHIEVHLVFHNASLDALPLVTGGWALIKVLDQTAPTSRFTAADGLPGRPARTTCSCCWRRATSIRAAGSPRPTTRACTSTDVPYAAWPLHARRRRNGRVHHAPPTVTASIEVR